MKSKVTISMLLSIVCFNLSISQTVSWQVINKNVTGSILAVIDTSTIYSFPKTLSKPYSFYKTSNGGLTWQTVTTDSLFAGNLSSVIFTSSLYGCMQVIDNSAIKEYILYTQDGGSTWNKSLTVFASGIQIQLCSNSPNGNIYIAYNDAVDQSSMIMRSIDNGKTFKGSNRFFRYYMYDISFPSNDTGYFCTGHWEDNSSIPIRIYNPEGSIYQSVDSGNSWNKIYSSPLKSGFSFSDITMIRFNNAKTGFASGDSLIFTKNAGIAWTIDPALSSITYRKNMVFSNETNGLIYLPNNSYFELYSTINGGNSWYSQWCKSYLFDVKGSNGYFYALADSGFLKGSIKYDSTIFPINHPDTAIFVGTRLYFYKAGSNTPYVFDSANVSYKFYKTVLNDPNVTKIEKIYSGISGGIPDITNQFISKYA